MHNPCGAEIESVRPDSSAHAAGMVRGDIILSINGNEVQDVIDVLFYGNDPQLDILVRRRDRELSFRLFLKEGQDTGIEIKPFKIRVCRNKCLFCFVSQLPKGLRKTLYVKDEDYRMSFLYGNYITLTNLTNEEKKRIVEQRLSPLYISIHSTDRAIRNTLLGAPKAPDVLKEIQFFKEHKIRMHCQIVLCPGYNDGQNLQQTIRDLYKFYPYVSSIAVVPVGLTAHRKAAPKLKAVGKDDALKAIGLIDSFQKRFRKKHGDPIVYAADELYIKAEAPFPPLRDYGELPQRENGVGMVPSFLHYAKRIKIPQPPQGAESGGPGREKTVRRRFVTFTGTSFYPYLLRFTDRLKKSGFNIEVVPVENTFFGKSVTVTGLLTGRDVMRSLTEFMKKDDILLIPDVVMREGQEVFLDDVSKQDIEDLLGITSRIIEATPKGLLEAISL